MTNSNSNASEKLAVGSPDLPSCAQKWRFASNDTLRGNPFDLGVSRFLLLQLGMWKSALILIFGFSAGHAKNVLETNLNFTLQPEDFSFEDVHYSFLAQKHVEKLSLSPTDQQNFPNLLGPTELIETHATVALQTPVNLIANRATWAFANLKGFLGDVVLELGPDARKAKASVGWHFLSLKWDIYQDFFTPEMPGFQGLMTELRNSIDPAAVPVMIVRQLGLNYTMGARTSVQYFVIYRSESHTQLIVVSRLFFDEGSFLFKQFVLDNEATIGEAMAREANSLRSNFQALVPKPAS